MCGISDKSPEETQHNLLHNIREGQLHGPMQSKLEYVMEVGQEDRWPAKLQILSGFLKPGKQAQERRKWKGERKKYSIVRTTCYYEHLKVNGSWYNCIFRVELSMRSYLSACHNYLQSTWHNIPEHWKIKTWTAR